MAWAVLDRVRASGTGWAIEANLSRGPITSSEGLAAHLAEQARAAKVRIDTDSERLREHIDDATRWAKAVGRIGELLGFDGASTISDAGQIGETIDQALASDEEGGLELRGVLCSLQAVAMAADETLVIFLDEAQRLISHWSGEEDSRYAQEALAEMMEDPDGRVVLLLAGSDRDGFERLMADGMPLHHDGMDFEVRPIAEDDWHHHLPIRFAEVGLDVERERIAQILEASGGHPQRTMRVCAHVAELADGVVYTVTDVVVEQAIQSARKHRSWRD